MNQAIKKKWLKALRSGGYEQDTGGLHTKTGFCCLGVLCDIQKARWRKEHFGYRFPIASFPKRGFLPNKFIAGLDLEEQSSLVDMNDGNKGRPKHSFSEIADYIEANL